MLEVNQQAFKHFLNSSPDTISDTGWYFSCQKSFVTLLMPHLGLVTRQGSTRQVHSAIMLIKLSIMRVATLLWLCALTSLQCFSTSKLPNKMLWTACLLEQASQNICWSQDTFTGTLLFLFSVSNFCLNFEKYPCFSLSFFVYYFRTAFLRIS